MKTSKPTPADGNIDWEDDQMLQRSGKTLFFILQGQGERPRKSFGDIGSRNERKEEKRSGEVEKWRNGELGEIGEIGGIGGIVIIFAIGPVYRGTVHVQGPR